MKLLSTALAADWADALSARTGRPAAGHELLATDFPLSGVLLEAEDGSMMHFRHAFALRSEADPALVAVFTEHNGYWLLKLTEDDRLHELVEREVVRWPGKSHCVPFSPCPLCGTDVDVVESRIDQAYEVECPGCGLLFGQPNGYGSCLYMAHDWNRRTDPDTLEEPPRT